MAARFYISHTLGEVYRYLLKDVLRPSSDRDPTHSVPRVTRWLFSIIRASIRLFDICVHPYRPSLNQVARLFPEMDLSVPYDLLAMREHPFTVCADDSPFVSAAAIWAMMAKHECGDKEG
jgi:hypothetical protein